MSALAPRIAALEAHNPEWSAWLALLRELERALADEGWVALSLRPAAGRAEGAPLLDGAELEVDRDRLAKFTARLAAAAHRDGAPLAGYRPSRDDAVRLVEATVRHDRAVAETLGTRAGADPAAVATVARVAAVPLLHACARALAPRMPAHWPHGYCPVCAAWPILVELRGLDRSRHLRCGRCAADWQVSWLACPFCGEKQHERLGSLVPEGERETWKVETCASCRGYLKSLATLQAVPPFELLLRDLETIELDLVAVDRGYTRPPAPGYALDVRVTARPA